MNEKIIAVIKNTFQLSEHDSISQLKNNPVANQILGFSELLGYLENKARYDKQIAEGLEFIVVSIKLKNIISDVEKKFLEEVDRIIDRPLYDSSADQDHEETFSARP